MSECWGRPLQIPHTMQLSFARNVWDGDDAFHEFGLDTGHEILRCNKKLRGVTSFQPTPREVDTMLVHATPREVNPGRAKSTHGHVGVSAAGSTWRRSRAVSRRLYSRRRLTFRNFREVPYAIGSAEGLLQEAGGRISETAENTARDPWNLHAGCGHLLKLVANNESNSSDDWLPLPMSWLLGGTREGVRKLQKMGGCPLRFSHGTTRVRPRSKQGGLPFANASPLIHTLWNRPLIHRVWIATCLMDVYHHDLRHILLHVYVAIDVNLRAGASAAL